MWFLPSLHRPARLAFCLNAIRTAGCSTPGKVILGADQAADIPGLPLPDGWTAVCQHPEDKSLVAVMNRFVKDHPDLAWYGFLQDDLHVRTPHWDTLLIAAAGSCGMASCNDMFKAPARMTSATVYGGDLIRAFGFWCPNICTPSSARPKTTRPISTVSSRSTAMPRRGSATKPVPLTAICWRVCRAWCSAARRNRPSVIPPPRVVRAASP